LYNSITATIELQHNDVSHHSFPYVTAWRFLNSSVSFSLTNYQFICSVKKTGPLKHIGPTSSKQAGF